MKKHNKLREILIKYDNKEYGDAIIDKISLLFNYVKTKGEWLKWTINNNLWKILKKWEI